MSEVLVPSNEPAPDALVRLRRLGGAAAALVWNPIVEKEILSRMRSWRAPVMISTFIALLALVAFGALAVVTAQQNGPFASTVTAGAGLGVFTAMVVVELLLILFMAPALTAGGISGERERQTLDLLLCTRVRPGAIVVGKLVSSLLFMVLLLVISVPLFSLVFLFGGIEIDQVLAVVVIGVVTALVIGSFGLMFSALTRGTISSTVSTYVGTAIFLLLPVVLPLFLSALVPPSPAAFSGGGPGQSIVMMLDPFVAVGSTMTPPGQGAQFNTVQRGVSSGSVTCVGGPGGVQRCTSTSVGLGTSPTAIPGGLAPGLGSTAVNPAATANSDMPFGNVRLNGDQIQAGPLTGWRAWQVFALFDCTIAVLALTLSTRLVGRRALGRRRPAMAVAPPNGVPPAWTTPPPGV